MNKKYIIEIGSDQNVLEIYNLLARYGMENEKVTQRIEFDFIGDDIYDEDVNELENDLNKNKILYSEHDVND